MEEIATKVIFCLAAAVLTLSSLPLATHPSATAPANAGLPAVLATAHSLPAVSATKAPERPATQAHRTRQAK